ncbi:hypothetical protein [Aquibacillus salsiterrae]|uniref:Uncharacterized protein n=1 Tax=Aquibacillus salsiterrae TaxID=2950439 RepID=A0A9X3WHG4_9BACI|nr:hypothetical protein [Aquibacillus salsiterrae]MDC3417106.1 hypothetical protein [Aquibacillus salsiterrae]
MKIKKIHICYLFLFSIYLLGFSYQHQASFPIAFASNITGETILAEQPNSDWKDATSLLPITSITVVELTDVVLAFFLANTVGFSQQFFLLAVFYQSSYFDNSRFSLKNWMRGEKKYDYSFYQVFGNWRFFNFSNELMGFSGN